MSVKSILSKTIFAAAVIGILVFAAMTPGVVRAFFVQSPVADLSQTVFQRQVNPAGSTDLKSAVLKEVSSTLADDMPGQVMTGTVELIGTLESKSDTSWVVSGVTVVLTTTTEVSGTLEVGTMVKVEGSWQVDGSILAHEIKAYTGSGSFIGAHIEFTGTVTAINTGSWMVDTTTVIITTTTEIKGSPMLGDKVKVEGYLQADGSVIAHEIKLLMEEEHGQEVEFKGILNAMNGNTWTVDTTTVIISTTTELKGTFTVGAKVEVKGYLQPDGTVLAKEVKVDDDGEESESEHENEGKGTEFVGEVTAINGSTWTVDGETVMITEKTNFEGDPQVGDKVRVAGQKQADGTILAKNIKLVTKDNGAGGNPHGEDNEKGKGSGGGDDHDKGGKSGGGDDHDKGGKSGGGDDHDKGGKSGKGDD